MSVCLSVCMYVGRYVCIYIYMHIVFNMYVHTGPVSNGVGFNRLSFPGCAVTRCRTLLGGVAFRHQQKHKNSTPALDCMSFSVNQNLKQQHNKQGSSTREYAFPKMSEVTLAKVLGICYGLQEMCHSLGGKAGHLSSHLSGD